jgi:hypothetical protein
MAEISRVKLFGKLNRIAYKSIESATVFCKLRGNPYIEVVHWISQILKLDDSDLHRIVRNFDLDASRLDQDLTNALERLPTGATSISDFSPHVESMAERGWLYATLLFGETQVRTGYLIVGAVSPGLSERTLYPLSSEFRKVRRDALTDDFHVIVKGSPETGLHPSDGFSSSSMSGSASEAGARTKDIFVCYRRDDSLNITERICDRLFDSIGEDRVFKDINSIPLGIRDFGQEIAARLKETRFFLPVIGKYWLNARDAAGQRRLDDPDDFVRMEIELALAGEAQVIPLMVDGAVMPQAAQLPESLRRLTRCPALLVRGGQDFKPDMQRLIDHIEQGPRTPRADGPR